MKARRVRRLAAGWLAAMLLLLLPAAPAAAVDLHFFWSADCPHCREMAATLEEIRAGAWVRLTGGALMVALGLALIFRPDWLAFAL